MPDSKFIGRFVSRLFKLSEIPTDRRRSQGGILSTRQEVERAAWLGKCIDVALSNCTSSRSAGFGHWVQFALSGRIAADGVRLASALSLVSPRGVGVRVLLTGSYGFTNSACQVCQHVHPEIVNTASDMVAAVSSGWVTGAESVRGTPPQAHIGVRVVRAGQRLDSCLAFGSVLEARAQNLCSAQMVYVAEGEAVTDVIEHIAKAGYGHRVTEGQGLSVVELAT